MFSGCRALGYGGKFKFPTIILVEERFVYCFSICNFPFLRCHLFDSILSIRLPGPEKCQNFHVNFKEMRNADNRTFSLNYLKRTLANGSVVDRDWVIFSPSLKSALCFSCKLFGTTDQNIEIFRTTGYDDWKNCSYRFGLHEKSKHHVKNVLAYRTRANQTNTLDAQFLKQEQIEMKYWREVLVKIVSVIKFLASRGLAFRGDDQIFGSHRNGNYLGILELLAEHDPFLANHIANYGNKGKGIQIMITFE